MGTQTSPPEWLAPLPLSPEGMAGLLRYFYHRYAPHAIKLPWDAPMPSEPGVYTAPFGKFLGYPTGRSLLMISGGDHTFGVAIQADGSGMQVRDPEEHDWGFHVSSWPLLHQETPMRRALGWLSLVDQLVKILPDRPLPDELANDLRLLEIALPELVDVANVADPGTQPEDLEHDGLHVRRDDTVLIFRVEKQVAKLIWEPLDLASGQTDVLPLMFTLQHRGREVEFRVETLDDGPGYQVVTPTRHCDLRLSDWRWIFDIFLGYLRFHSYGKLTDSERHVISYLKGAYDGLRSQTPDGLVQHDADGGVTIVTPDPTLTVRLFCNDRYLSCIWGLGGTGKALVVSDRHPGITVSGKVHGAEISWLMRVINACL